ncbi:serine/arginine repetitive matrix protein 1-like [Lineus longissimus]|uniref:serine/arginine repetitive matrix protein 1-like n=1 Tax=Lineus longissimus TaxID=88925 RepID=UPI002B4F26EC
MASQGNDCFYFYNATCFKGERCQYRHCDAALGSEMVCEDWMNGICFIDDCPYRHMEVQVEPQQNNVPCFYDMQPGGCRRPKCQFIHTNRAVQPGQSQPAASAGFTSLVEIKLVSDLPPNEDPSSTDLPPHQMSMSYEEPYSIPAVIGSHRMSGEVELVSPQVEPIIINPMEDESSDPESSPSLSPVKNAGKSGSLEGIPEEGGDVRNVDQKDGKPDAEETGTVKADTSKSDEEEAEEEEVEESEEEEEEDSVSTECEDEASEETECEDERPVIELFDTEGHEVLGEVGEKSSEVKGNSSKNGKKTDAAEKKVSKEDTDLSEVLSLEDVMRRKALESMYKRRAEKEKAKQEEEKKKDPEKNKEGPEKKKEVKDDRKKPRRSRSRSRSPYRRGRSPDLRSNWRGRRRPSPFGRDGRRSPPPFGRRSPPFGRRSPPRRRSPFRRNDRRDPAHRLAVQRLRGQRNQAERDLEELAVEANKLEQKIRSSAESVKILKQVELKKRKELLRKQLEEVSKELAKEGDDSSSSSSSSSSCSCTESDSTSQSSSPKKKVSVIASKVHRHQPHKHKHDKQEKNTGARQPLTLEELRRRRALKTQPLSSAQRDSDGSVTLEEIRRRRALKTRSLNSTHADSDGSGKIAQGLSLAEIRRKRALKFGMVKPASGSEEDTRRSKQTKVAKSSSDEQSSGDEEGSQGSGPKELVILKKVEPLRKMNIRKVVSQGSKNSGESLESQVQRELKNKNALRNIQVQRIVRNESANARPEPSAVEMLELQSERQRLLQKLKDVDVEEETGEVAEKQKPSSDGEAKVKPKTSFRRVLVVGKEEPKKDTSVAKAATDIVIKSLEDIKKAKERQRDTLRVPEDADTADNSQRRKLSIPRNKSDTNLLKRSATIGDEDSEAKRRFVRRNPQQIYVPPAAAKFRETAKVDEPATTATSLPASKFVEEVAPKAEAQKIPISRLKEAKSSGGEIVVKTFSEIMKEKRERKQKELEEKRAAAASKTVERLSKPKPAFISPITFASDKDKPKASLSETTLPKRKLYSEPEKQESRMLANWGARRTKVNKVQPNDTKFNSTGVRTNTPPQKSQSESSVSSQKMEVIDLPPDDDDLDLDEFEMELRDEMESTRSNPEPVVSKPSPAVTKPVPVTSKSKGSGESVKTAAVVNSVKAMAKSVEPVVAAGKRKTNSEEKSKPTRRTSTSDNLLDEFDLLLEEDDDDLGTRDTELQVQDDDALLMELEEMLA